MTRQARDARAAAPPPRDHRRRAFAALIVGVALVVVPACSSSRSDTLRRFEAAVVRVTPLAWGEAAVPEVVVAERARFECLWDRLDDPEEEIACHIDNLEAVARCLEGVGSDEVSERVQCILRRSSGLGAEMRARWPEGKAGNRMACAPGPGLAHPLGAP